MDAVEEVRLAESPKLSLLRGLLKGLPDLARGLCSIQYGRVSGPLLAETLTHTICQISLHLKSWRLS